MHILSNFHHEASQRYEGQEESILLSDVRDNVSCEKQISRVQSRAFAWTYRKEIERRNTRKNVRRTKRKASQSQGSNFLQECRSRKGRYSLNCAVMRRSADKEPHVNNLETPFFTMAGRVSATAVLHELTKAAHVKLSLIDLEARWGDRAEGASHRERLSEKARKGCDSPNRGYK